MLVVNSVTSRVTVRPRMAAHSTLLAKLATSAVRLATSPAIARRKQPTETSMATLTSACQPSLLLSLPWYSLLSESSFGKHRQIIEQLRNLVIGVSFLIWTYAMETTCLARSAYLTQLAESIGLVLHGLYYLTLVFSSHKRW